MTGDELDRILSSEEPLEPSSGFVAGVMEAIRAQAAAPPPLPFPWRRFAVGLVACVILAAAGTALLLPRARTPGLAAMLAPLAAVGPELAYAMLALIVSIGLARLPRAFARP